MVRCAGSWTRGDMDALRAFGIRDVHDGALAPLIDVGANLTKPGRTRALEQADRAALVGVEAIVPVPAEWDRVRHGCEGKSRAQRRRAGLRRLRGALPSPEEPGDHQEQGGA